MADPAFNPSLNANRPNDNVLMGTVEQSMMGTPIGLVYQQLKIIAMLLREGMGVNQMDEDISLLGQLPQTLNPPLTPTI